MNELRPDEIFHLLGQVQSHASHAFSGLGLIFYSSLADLPIVALGDQELFPRTLPVTAGGRLNVQLAVARRVSPH